MQTLCELCDKRLAALKEIPYPTPAGHVYWPGHDISRHLCAECRTSMERILAEAGDSEASNAFVPLGGGQPIYVSCRHCGRLNHGKGESEREGDRCDVVYLDLAHRGGIHL